MKKLIQEILTYLKKLKPSVGQFEENYKEVKQFLIDRLLACDNDFKNDNIYLELFKNYAKLAKLFEVLTVFDIKEDDKKKIHQMSKIISQIDRAKGNGGENDV
jgi:hypothetical protein